MACVFYKEINNPRVARIRLPVFASMGASDNRTGLQSLCRPQVQTVQRQESSWELIGF